MEGIVHTCFGSVRGKECDGVWCFLGIPYAQPPLGDLRFREPKIVLPWTGIRRAFHYAKDPMQYNTVYGPEHYSEDCLYLNIWVPYTTEEKTPVIVWVPGGAFATGGSGAINEEGPSMYNCRDLAKDTGCIVVSISYRLNVFGFLNLSFLSSRFDDHIGMKDIIMALRWVHEAISDFGGDEENITLMGESAGAGAISALLLIDEAQPYFHKAIIESNCFGSFYTPKEGQQVARLYLNWLGLADSEADELLFCPYQKLFEAEQKLKAYVAEHYTGRCSFCPVVDGTFIKEFPTLSTFAGLGKSVLLGSNKDEGNFQATYTWTDPAKYTPLLLRRLTHKQSMALLDQYPALPEKKAFGKLLTDVMYAFPKLRFAEHLSQAGNSVYLYRFDYYTTTMENLGLYACHVSELLPLFEFKVGPYRSFIAGDESEVHEIGVRMRRYWGAFARYGIPKVEGQIEWKPYTLKSRHTLIIDRTDRLELDPERDIRAKFAQINRVLI